MIASKLRNLDGSIGVTLPEDMLNRFGLTADDQVHLVETEDGILIRPYNSELQAQIDAIRSFTTEHRNAFRELAK